MANSSEAAYDELFTVHKERFVVLQQIISALTCVISKGARPVYTKTELFELISVSFADLNGETNIAASAHTSTMVVGLVGLVPSVDGYFAMPNFDDIRLSASSQEKSGLSSDQTNLVDLYKETYKTQLKPAELLYAQAGKPEEEDQGVTAYGRLPLNEYLIRRDEQQKDQTWYGLGVSKITRFGRQLAGMEDASSKFDQAIKDNDQTAMMALRRQDFKQRRFEDNASHYSSAMLKTGLLFSGTKVGFVGLVGVTTSDGARPSDPFQKQAVDAALGAAKGIATRLVFENINAQAWDPVAKGLAFGVSDRFIDSGLSSRTYEDRAGDTDLLGGAKKTVMNIVSPESLLAEAGSGAVSAALLYPINMYTKGAFFAHPLASKVAMAGVSGLTSGSLRELNFQQDIGRKTDWLDIAKKGGEKAGLDMLSALPNPRGLPFLK